MLMWDSANDFDRRAMQGEDTGVDEAEPLTARHGLMDISRCEYLGSDLSLQGQGLVIVDPERGIWFEPDFRGGDVFRIEPGDYKIL